MSISVVTSLSGRVKRPSSSPGGKAPAGGGQFLEGGRGRFSGGDVVRVAGDAVRPEGDEHLRLYPFDDLLDFPGDFSRVGPVQLAIDVAEKIDVPQAHDFTGGAQLGLAGDTGRDAFRDAEAGTFFASRGGD